MEPSDDDGPDDMSETVHISRAKQLAARVVDLLKDLDLSTVNDSGLYETALDQAHLLLDIVAQSESSLGAEEFDVLLYLIRRLADNLADTITKILKSM